MLHNHGNFVLRLCACAARTSCSRIQLDSSGVLGSIGSNGFASSCSTAVLNTNSSGMTSSKNSSNNTSTSRPRQLSDTLFPRSCRINNRGQCVQHAFGSVLGTRGLSGVAQGNDKNLVLVVEELSSKLKDPGLLHSAGYVGGQWLQASDRATYQVTNPATGKFVARMPLLRGEETKSAIASAHSVWPTWKNLTAKERSAYLKRWYDELMKVADDLATIVTTESGKPLAEARTEVITGAASVEWFAEECKRVCGDVLETSKRDRRMITLKQPVGVVGAITPWNFPFSMITRKVAPALAAGCTVVLKPAELTPLTAVAIAECAERAGIPDGVLNIVMGDAPAIGNALLNSEFVRKIGFTGSTTVGKQLMAQAAQTVKRVSLELGGNAPFLVFDDADLDLAAKGVVSSALRNAGQTCICTNRAFVQDSVYDKFADLVHAHVEALKVGDGLEEGVTMGPLITPQALTKVEAHVTDATKKGGQVIIGGDKPVMAEPLSGGNFFKPTVVKNATIDMRCFREETFGPLVPLFRFKTDDEAIMLANDTEYGLASYFYTKDLRRAWHAAEEMEYGMIGINETSITSEVAPFGGVKQSGLGREQSKYGIDEFMEIKYVCMGLGYSC